MKFSYDLLIPFLSIAVALIYILIGVIGFFARDAYNRMKEEQTKQSTDIKSLEEKFVKTKEDISKEYVRKDEFFREINKIDQKIDRIGEHITEIHKIVSAMGGNHRA
ncbi:MULTISPECIES: hypothetical protein [Brevibacillus]|uniref:hypothetical protein n=1 Tax=Brevibacillus TaxID=55080 RepID=UPI000D0EFCF9|nr:MULTISPECIES: hypothetical protein [Brevibacillus]PSJ66953.1 hypothetical protein C7J99_23000 [Brevibacillus brevis]RED27768.1 hypothetical protein DES34_10960 [Brevibacillus brevis]TQK42134.1 hypothetical protein FB479_115126 [Brevibacillus sp. AG162]VEF86805.1 Uncharacterised protein [Brevibacillus brevis]GEC88608.1 hypothetical protein BBR01nite_09390 [Brevibacillus brevis]